MAEHALDSGGILLDDPCESYPLELYHLVLLIEEGLLRISLGNGSVGHEYGGLDVVPSDPLDGLESVPEDGHIVSGVLRRCSVIDVAEVLESNLSCFGEHLGVGTGDEDGPGVYDLVLPVAPLGVIRMQGCASGDDIDSVDIVPDGILYEEVPVGFTVDDVPVHSVEVLPGELDVYLFHTGLDPVSPDGFRSDSASLECPDGSGPDIVPSGVLAVENALLDERGLQDGVRDVDQSVVVEVGLLPAHVVVDVFLPVGVVEVVLSSDDVRHSHEVVVDGD